MEARLQKLIGEVLDVPPAAIDGSAGPQRYAQWDSVAHIEILLSVEAEFGVRLGTGELETLLSAGAIEDWLRRKGAL